VPPDDLADLYAGTSARLVGLLTAMGGSRDEAEEVCQDAWARLVVAWDKVHRYDDPEAWVRSVAVRLLISRHRRRDVARRALPRLLTRDDVQAQGPERIGMEQALRQLPLNQRTVLVLHYVVDLPVEEIATALGVPVGTVKSRLSRGRDALALLLTTEEVPHD
jgi:RNA polymerase sigma-70 factor (ECF subfamily)